LIEFKSPYEPADAIPVSETGYRSFFAPMSEIAEAPSLEKYVSMVALFLIHGDQAQDAADTDQLDLF
jgi:hypothetical protein